MSASSGPGISLKQECVSFLAGSELPCVIVDIMRAGPGLGNIGPEQSDYFQIVKGGGHGNYRVVVLAPGSVSEMYEMTIRAFDLADKYRNPVYVLADATIGQMMEPIDVAPVDFKTYDKSWRLDATAATNHNMMTSIFLDFDDMEAHVTGLEAKYKAMHAAEAMVEVTDLEGADLVLTGYGIVSRVLRSMIVRLSKQGIKAAMVRPKTLWPFPDAAFKEIPQETPVLVVELSMGQFVEDVRLSIPNHRVELCKRVGGNLPTEDQLAAAITSLLEG